MLPRRGNLFFFTFVFSVFFVTAEKAHFSTWINTDAYAALFHFETLLNTGLHECIETCKSKKGCKYINYRTQAHTCAFVGVTPDIEDHLMTENKKGYMFGNKSEWNMDKYVVCDDCDNHGVCGKKELTGDINSRCQHSGCEPPVQLPLTVVYGNMFSVGASIKYECTDGYKPILINDSSNPITDQHVLPESYISAVCQENGKWNLSSFLCLPECTTLLYHVGLPNIARGKPVTMSSQFNRDSPAKLMVDGNLDNKWPCASTNKENNPWALIDLDQSYKVTSLYIVNRMDCCTSRLHNLAIAIADDPSNLVRAAYRQEAIGCDFSFNLGGGIRGRFIKLQIESYEYLTICELEVYTG